MEAITLKFPETLDEFGEDELVRLPASWEEYLELAEDAPYTVQFLNHEVIMSQASRLHESLVGILIWLFNNLLIDKEGYDVLGSNVKIMIPNQEADFNADLSVVKEPVEYGTTPTGRVSTMRIANPEIVVEVLSKSTRKFDQGEKLAYYKLIPSLQHILFVDQSKPFASVYSRTGNPDEWLNHDYRMIESVVQLGDMTLPMQDIYRKTVFES
jgi:Uma2 family endonuclease